MGRGTDHAVIGLEIFAAAAFVFIRDLINIHPLWCMYMLHLINDALGVYPNSPTTSRLIEPPLEQMQRMPQKGLEVSAQSPLTLQFRKSMRWLHRDQVRFIANTYLSSAKKRRKAICSYPFRQSRPGEKHFFFLRRNTW